MSTTRTISNVLLRDPPPRIRTGFSELDLASWGQVCDAINAKLWPIVFQGAPGVGKTSAAALVYQLWPHSSGNYEPGFYELGELTRLLCDAKYGRPGSVERKNGQMVEMSVEKIMDICSTTDLLVLDDLGAVFASPQNLDCLTSILNWSQHRPAIVTTNFTPQQVDQIYGPRIASRLFAGATVKFTGYDRRGKR